MIQSGCTYTHGTVADVSWHVQNCEMIWSLFFISEQNVILQNYHDYEIFETLCEIGTWDLKI